MPEKSQKSDVSTVAVSVHAPLPAATAASRLNPVYALVAAPFKAAMKEPEPGPELPRSQPLPLGAETPRAEPPPPAPMDYESAMVDQLERELDSRNRASGTAPESGAGGASSPVGRTATSAQLK